MQMVCVEAQVVTHKRSNEVVAVVVAFLHSHLNWVVGSVAGVHNQVRFELLSEEVIRRPLVNEYGSLHGRLTQPHARVIVGPS